MAIRLSDLARQDLDDVRRHTVERWGQDQWLRYFRGLVEVFERIDADPTAGQGRDLLVKGMRSVLYERHIVFFAPAAAAGGARVVLRIAHQSRNLAALAYYDDLEGP